MEQKKQDLTEAHVAALFDRFVGEVMVQYAGYHRKATENAESKGMYIKRGAYERLTWSRKYIAEQWNLCIQKKCQLPSTLRALVRRIGDTAWNMVIAELAKERESLESTHGKETTKSEEND